MPSEPAKIVVVSGLPGSGKTTVARLLAGRLVPGAHVEADQLQQMVVSGGVWPEGTRDMSPEAARQLRLRLHNACLLARSFQMAGFNAVIDDIVAGPRLHELMEDLAGLRFALVMLRPDFETVHRRWTDAGSPFAEIFRWIEDEFRLRTPRVGLWLDTTALDPEETVATILRRLEEAEVPA